jgi:hypothetical protein
MSLSNCQASAAIAGVTITLNSAMPIKIANVAFVSFFISFTSLLFFFLSPHFSLITFFEEKKCPPKKEKRGKNFSFFFLARGSF